MLRLTPQNTQFSIWVSDLAAVETAALPRAREVASAESAHITCVRSHMLEAHVHEEHEVLTIVHGAGRLILEDGRSLQAATGQICIVPGGLSHQLVVDDHLTLRGLYLHPLLCRQLAAGHARDPLLAQLAQVEHPLPPRVVSDAHLFRSLQECFEQSQAEYAQRDRWQTESLLAIGRLVAVTFVRLMQLDAHTLPPDPTTQRVLNVRAWMDRHFLDDLRLADLARMAQLSPSQFSALFRQLCALPPKAYLIQRRLNQACSLLAETDLSITDIAAGVGFDHLAHFGRLFREHTGQSPREYRKNDQKQPRNMLD
jgi:AraC-like DNA-binding protein